MATLLVIDNYDSFTYNLVQMFMLYDLDIRVFRSDRIGLSQIKTLAPDYVLISPGPKDPARAGISCRVIETFGHRVPLLGVCLGMQCINEVFGGRTVRAPVPVHGKTSTITHNGQGMFDGIPSPLQVARYHSLMAEGDFYGAPLTITAKSDDGVIMGLAHAHQPIHGVQFHPESFLTAHGYALIDNFLKLGPLADQSGALRDTACLAAVQARSPAPALSC